MSVRDRVASLLVLNVAGTDAPTLSAFVEDHHPGGLILMGDNIAGSAADVAAVMDAVQTPVPMLLAVDQEGGIVQRLPGDAWPAGAQLHDLPVTATTDAFAQRARLVADAGLNLNFGIVADTTADSDSFIFPRTLGATPDGAAERVAAAVAAEAQAGVLATLKHFPGHGAAPGDSHTSLPMTDLPLESWRTRDALPFAAGIAAGAPVVMFGHLIFEDVDSTPSSMSAIWLSLLRNELDFTGIAITDDMGMLEHSGDPRYADRIANAVLALQAGMTMLLYVVDGPQPVSVSELIDGITAAVTDGRIPEQTITDAATIVMEQRLALAEG